jgi:hypothetical protein
MVPVTEACVRFLAIMSLSLALATAAFAAETPPSVSFRTDVMAVLSKAGCNAGACHGNRNGKGGLKLSLRGQDAEGDFASLTRDLYARRTNALEPEKSLILLKATTAVSHQGGKRFAANSREYRILHDWITAGMQWDTPNIPTVVGLEVTPGRQVLVAPRGNVKINATAVFSDGTRRDVSDLAVYEQSQELAKVSPNGQVNRGRDGETAVVVRFLQYQRVVRLAFVPERPGFAWQPFEPHNYIDTHILAKLKELRINPSGPANDLQFMRRAYLDLLGILPTADEAREFEADKSQDKRATLANQLLDRPEYADFWALKWSDLLRNEERALDRKGVKAFHRWIRQSVADNKPLDRFARELVAARGSTYTNPATNFYRAERDPLERGEDAAEVFLGLRLKCARCHNHPFDRWSQDDYYNWADVFGRLNYRVIENRRTDINDKHEFIGEQIVYEAAEGDVADPRPGHQTRPMLLGTGATITDDQDRLDALAEWIADGSNPFFAKAQVNRIWFNLMGRGLVDPVDDFRATNPATHPKLLDLLAAEFVAHGYDARHIIRLIMSSRTYGLSSEPNDTNGDDELDYSHVVPRRLTAEQLLDAAHQVMQTPAEFTGYANGIRAGQLSGVRIPRKEVPTAADKFLVTFGKPPRLLVSECERSNETSLGQAFQLISGPELAKMLSNPDNCIGQMITARNSDGQIIEELYLAALSRPPTAEESTSLCDHVTHASSRREGLEDVAWALLNAKEFVLRK